MKETYSFTCCICHKHITGEYGNNPFPVYNAGECCDTCNRTIVLPLRKEHFKNNK